MKDKKHIDRIFQEKFKDFEVAPEEKVWENIAQELKEKNKRKAIYIPLWYKVGGIAAAIAGIFFLANPLFNDSTEPKVVNTPREENSTDEVKQKNTFSENDELKNNSGRISTSESGTKKNASEEVSTSTKFNKKQAASGIASTSKVSEKKSDDANISKRNNSTEEKTTTRTSTTNENTSRLAENSTPSSAEENSTRNDFSIESEDKKEKSNPDSKLAENNLDEDISTEEKLEKSLVETAEKLEEEKSLAEKLETPIASKWMIKPNVSPIFYNSLNGGNTVDPQFVNNDAKGEVTMAYGVNFAYSISEKMKIRSGISKVNMSYNTNDVAISSTVNAMALNGVNNNRETENVQVVGMPLPGENNTAPFAAGTLNQRFGYLEVPVELEYALLNKRFGIHLIGGASTFFLDQNVVSVNSDFGTTQLGEANNLNNVSFSTNIGLGLGYELTKKVNLNLEPTFKYQLNTFSGNTNGFTPYFFGVYTGLSFKF